MFFRKSLDQFEGQSSRCKGRFKLDIGFLKTNVSKSHSEFYIELFKKNIEYQDMEAYKKIIVPFDIYLIKKYYEKKYQT